MFSSRYLESEQKRLNEKLDEMLLWGIEELSITIFKRGLSQLTQDPKNTQLALDVWKAIRNTPYSLFKAEKFQQYKQYLEEFNVLVSAEGCKAELDGFQAKLEEVRDHAVNLKRDADFDSTIQRMRDHYAFDGKLPEEDSLYGAVNQFSDTLQDAFKAKGRTDADKIRLLKLAQNFGDRDQFIQSLDNIAGLDRDWTGMVLGAGLVLLSVTLASVSALALAATFGASFAPSALAIATSTQLAAVGAGLILGTATIGGTLGALKSFSFFNESRRGGIALDSDRIFEEIGRADPAVSKLATP